MAERNNGYVPDRLFTGGTPHVVEIAPPRNGQLHLGHETIGAPDGDNRDQHWRWADVSGDGTRWSHFRGHHVQVDIELHTANRREVNEWKGRDEVRAEGTWILALARQQCWEGYLRNDPLDQLIEIRSIAQRLVNHDAIDWRLATPVAEQLLGRRVYFQRTPAVISSTSVLSQGCVMLKPVGVAEFPPPAWGLDRDDYFDDERGEIKTELLDPHVWWWRDKPAGDEPRPEPVTDPCDCHQPPASLSSHVDAPPVERSPKAAPEEGP